MPSEYEIDGGTEKIQSAAGLKARLQVNEQARRSGTQATVVVLKFKIHIFLEIPANAGGSRALNGDRSQNSIKPRVETGSGPYQKRG